MTDYVQKIRVRQVDEPRVRVRVLPRIPPLEIELQNTGTVVQWRLGTTGTWVDLIEIDDIDASVTIGTVTTLAPGASATVTNVGTPQNVILDFGLPAGFDGQVVDITAGQGIAVDSTDPAHPIVTVDAIASEIPFTPTGAIAATNVQTAIAELDTEKQPLDSDLTALASAFSAASSSGPASLAFAEDTDNGTNKVTVQAASALASDVVVTLPSVTGTVPTGPTSTTDNTLPRFDGAAGALQTSGVAIDDSNNVSGVAQLTTSGSITNGATSGGTYNGNTVVATSDQFPSITWRSATTAKVQHLADVNAGAYYVDAPGGYNIRDTINGGNTIMAFAAARMTAGVPLKVKSYTVASLPSGQAGDMAFASNGRALAGSTGAANLTVQGAGAGTGCLVVHNGTSWQVAGLNTTVAA